VGIDGTKVRANNSKRNNFSARKLEAHIAYIDKKIAEYMNELDKNDKIEELEERKAKYSLFKERIKSGEVTEVSTTDPDSRLMKQGNNGVDVSYNVQAALDSKHKMIAGVLVVNEANDQGQLHKTAKAVKDNLGLKEMTVLADKGYYSTDDFKKCHDDNITTIVAKPEDHKRAGKETLNKSNFRYDKENDCYYCPAVQILRFAYEDGKGVARYRNLKACGGCKLKPHCTKSNRRDISRHKYAEHAEQNDRDFANHQDIYRLRQQLCEHPFGTVKRTMGIRQFLTRGLTNVNAEAALIFLVYNLKRLRAIHKNDSKKDGQTVEFVRLFVALILLYNFVAVLTGKYRFCN
jgi:IS5 family transposase